MVYKKKFNPFTGKPDYIWNNNDLTDEPTGFSSPEDVIISYDSSTRKITLTGTVDAYWKGNKISVLTSGWVSDAHTATNGPWFLYYNGSTFVWSQTAWAFEMLQIAFIYYGVNDKFGIRESHGMMQWQNHEEFHQIIGTYLTSGGDLSSYVLNSTTAGDRRPTVSATYVKDEDLPTTNPVLSSDLFTHHYLTSTATNNFTVDSSDIVPLSGSQPYYNQFTGGAWTQTLLPVGAYMNVWLIAFPTTSDVTSQKYRYVWMQGQQQSNTLSVIQSLTPNSLNLGNLSTLSPEFVFIGRVIIRYIAGNWQLIQVDKLTGSRSTQSITSTGSYLSSVTTDSTLTGAGTVANPLSVVSTKRTITTVSSTPYTITSTDGVFLVNASSGAITINLPTAVGANGFGYDIKKIDSTTNNVTIETNSTETIDGSDGIIINNQNDSYSIVSDNSNWRII